MLKYAVYLKGKGYYAEYQPHYEYSWCDNVDDALLYRTTKKFKEILRKMKLTCDKEGISVENVEIQTVEIRRNVVNKMKPFVETNLNVSYEDDGKNFHCTIIDTDTRRSYKGKHARYKKRAYKEAYAKYIEEVC